MKKRILCALALPVLVFSFFAFAFGAPASALTDPELAGAEAVILYHNDSTTTLYEKDADKVLPAGVIARLTAALVFAEYFEGRSSDLIEVDRRVTGLASSELVLENGKSARLTKGEHIPVYDLLCALLIANSNDAAYALAFGMFDGADTAAAEVVAAMNEKAAALGAQKTVFTDMLGLASDGGAYGKTTARDALKIALAVQKNRLLGAICETPRYVIPATDKVGARLLLTRNYLLSAERQSGFTYRNARGLCAEESAAFGSYGLFTAQSEGRTYTCVILGGTEKLNAFRAAKSAFEWGISHFSYKKVLDTIEVLGEVKVELSNDYDYVTVSPAQAISVFLPNDVDVKTEISRSMECKSVIRAPVSEGDEVGSITVYYKGEPIGTSKLVTIASLPLSNSGYYFSLFLNFVTSPVFLIAAICVAVFFVSYILINARVRYLRKYRPSSLRFEEDDGEPGGARIAESAVYEALTDGSGRTEETKSAPDGQMLSAGSAPADAHDRNKPVKEKRKNRKNRKNKAAKAETPDSAAVNAETEEPESEANAAQQPKDESPAPEEAPATRQIFDQERDDGFAPVSFDAGAPEQTEEDGQSEEGAAQSEEDAGQVETAAVASRKEKGADGEAGAQDEEETPEDGDLTELERLAAVEEAKEEAARRAKEEEEQRALEEEKRAKQRVFYDLEKDKMTAVEEGEEQAPAGSYEPEGWERYRPGGG